MSGPMEWQKLLSFLETCDPKWLARALFSRQQTDPVLEKLCQLKVGIEKGKQGDLEALRLGLEAALNFSGSDHTSYLPDDYDLILTQSAEDLGSLRELPHYEASIKPLLEAFVASAANVSTEFEEGFSWWSALEALCARLNLSVPESP